MIIISDLLNYLRDLHQFLKVIWRKVSIEWFILTRFRHPYEPRYKHIFDKLRKDLLADDCNYYQD